MQSRSLPLQYLRACFIKILTGGTLAGLAAYNKRLNDFAADNRRFADFAADNNRLNDFVADNRLDNFHKDRGLLNDLTSKGGLLADFYFACYSTLSRFIRCNQGVGSRRRWINRPRTQSTNRPYAGFYANPIRIRNLPA